MLEYQQYEKKNGAETDEKNRNYRMRQYGRRHSLWCTRKRCPGQRKCLCIRHQAGMRGAVIERINVSTEKFRSL